MQLSQLIQGMQSAVALHEIPDEASQCPSAYRFLAINPAFERILDKPADAVVGRTVGEVMSSIEPTWIERYGKVSTSGEALSFEDYCQCLGRYFEVIAYCPKPDRFVTVFTDITQQKRQEERLRLAECALNSCGDAVYWLDWQGRFVYANKTACTTTGYSRDELLAMRVHDLNPNFPEAAWSKMWARLESQNSFNIESVHRKKNGCTYPVSVTASLFEVGEQRYGCAIARDITEFRHSEECRQNQARLEATATLAGGIAHDFNNLMTGVLGNAELLAEALDGDPTMQKMLADIITSAQRAGALAQQMLAFAGSGKTNQERLNLAETLKECLQSSDVAFSGNIALETDIDGDLLDINADRPQMAQVIINLLSNATEAIETIGRIKIRAFNATLDAPLRTATHDLPAGQYVSLQVTDDGAGMTPETAGKVFDPFFTTKFPGRGLGLSAVHGIVASHGGSILIESQYGKGTTVTVYFPALEPRTASVAPALRLPVEASEQETILVVEDEPLVQNITMQMLQKEGYRVIGANNGREAVSLVERFEGDIHAVILDLEMPLMHGSEALPLIKTRRPETAVILCSGHAMDAVTSRLLDVGASAFIQKPFRHRKLVSVVQQVLGEQKNTAPLF